MGSFFSISIAYSQEIPNPSFEEWVFTNPVGWFGFGVGPSNDAYAGDYSAILEVADDGNVPLFIAGDVVPGITISERYESFIGHYKLNSNGGDFLKVDVILGLDENVIAIGSVNFFSPPSSDEWLEFDVPINYSTDDTPNTALIFFSITNQEETATPGSAALIDLVAFDITTDIGEFDGISDEKIDLRNYPNPFVGSTTIAFELNNPAEVTLEVYNLTGSKVATILKREMKISGQHEIYFDASNLPSGLYFYTLSTDDFVVSRRMNCVK